MLKSTFIHLPHVNKNSELKLWKSGVLTWDIYSKKEIKQLYLSKAFETQSIIEQSKIAFENQDISYFSNKLSHKEYYRLALSYPEQVMFLDIETTGLSLYYDYITIVGWSLGNTYNVQINGQDTDILYAAIKKAKLIVTFNGTLFDLKFLKKNFEGIEIPPIHIDLRFFAKRVGLTGGQKNIEAFLGIKRKNNISDIPGEAAPVLWYQYRRGDIEALKRLIEYNHADIEGMKAIFDACVALQCKKDRIPPKVRTKVRFKRIKSTISWANQNDHHDKDGIFIPIYSGSRTPHITYDKLNTIIKLDSFCVAGVDLVSAEDRETGFCILKGNKAKTSRLKTDESIIAAAIEANAQLISIDSPLSIPKGRTSFWDNDPTRKQFGITRECERILKRRGISSYPCLIPSMQKLTERGMLLATKFRKLGIPVIESYPGAAQDIMNIPRKQAGLKYLTEGLREFGICGDFLEQSVSHDELDAITSAIVGLFFWAGKFERLGNADEEYLIIPDLQADHTIWLNNKVIGLSGFIRTGKSTIAMHMKEKSYMTLRFSDVLRRLLQERHRPVTRSTLQEIGFEIYASGKQRWLEAQLISLACGRNIVIDGLRFPEDHAALVEYFGPSFKHLHIYCEESIRRTRPAATQEEDISLEEASQHSVESSIAALSHLAHFHISNNGTREELFQQVAYCIGENKCQ